MKLPQANIFKLSYFIQFSDAYFNIFEVENLLAVMISHSSCGWIWLLFLVARWDNYNPYKSPSTTTISEPLWKKYKFYSLAEHLRWSASSKINTVPSSKRAAWVPDTTWKKLPEAIVEFCFRRCCIFISQLAQNTVLWGKTWHQWLCLKKYIRKSQTLDVKFQ